MFFLRLPQPSGLGLTPALNLLATALGAFPLRCQLLLELPQLRCALSVPLVKLGLKARLRPLCTRIRSLGLVSGTLQGPGGLCEAATSLCELCPGAAEKVL